MLEEGVGSRPAHQSMTGLHSMAEYSLLCSPGTTRQLTSCQWVITIIMIITIKCFVNLLILSNLIPRPKTSPAVHYQTYLIHSGKHSKYTSFTLQNIPPATHYQTYLIHSGKHSKYTSYTPQNIPPAAHCQTYLIHSDKHSKYTSYTPQNIPPATHCQTYLIH